MKQIDSIAGKCYIATAPNGGTVTDEAGRTLATVEAGEQKAVWGTDGKLYLSDDDGKLVLATFNHAPAALALLGGGDKLPAGYTRLEYLESTGAQRINTNIIPTNKSGFKLALTYIHGHGDDNKTNYIFGCQTRSGGEAFHVYLGNERVGVSLSPTTIFYNKKRLSQLDKFEISANYKNDSVYYVDGEDTGVLSELNYTPIFYIWMFRSSFKSNTSFDPSYPVRVWSCEMTEGEATSRNYVPALDPTGAPCMFDFVTRKPFYNSGTGDFLYPGKEQEATTYSLRRPRMYAQMTQHGIRRLYHVPKGYNGTKEEYADENGFKLLVETPQPEEGYWAPVWHDREDCIELEWVETEPPEEELSTEA